MKLFERLFTMTLSEDTKTFWKIEKGKEKLERKRKLLKDSKQKIRAELTKAIYEYTEVSFGMEVYDDFLKLLIHENGTVYRIYFDYYNNKKCIMDVQSTGKKVHVSRRVALSVKTSEIVSKIILDILENTQ